MSQKLPLRRRPIADSTALWELRGTHRYPGGSALVYSSPLRGITVLSDSCIAPSGRGNKCPHWHVSVSRQRGRVSDTELRLVRHDFDMLEAEEDGHDRFTRKVLKRRNKARHLWLPEPIEERGPCACKDDDDQALIEGAGSAVEVRTEGGEA